MISNCGHDENNRYRGGSAGDQTGKEWEIIPWYNRPWNVVLRFPDEKIANMIADMAEACAKNNNIGYDQDQRYTFWYALKAAGYDPSKIDQLCEADCSSGASAIVKATGYRLGVSKLKAISIYTYSGNIKNVLQKAGANLLTDKKYLTSDQYLKRGDILVLENHHVAINITTGPKAEDSQNDSEKIQGWVQSGKDWYYRVKPGVNQHGFAIINHHKYYFDSTGKMLKGWYQVNGEWYYAQPDGELEGAMYHTDSRGAQSIWNL